MLNLAKHTIKQWPSLGVETKNSLGQITTAHKRYKAERDRITAELVEVGETDIQQTLSCAVDIRTAIEGDAIGFHVRWWIIERLKVTAQIKYQNNERGMWIECPVLANASKWKKLDQVCERFFTNEYNP